MTDEQQAAFINSQTAIFNAVIAGMVAENNNRMMRGESLAYTEAHFQEAIENSGINYNQVVGLFQRR